MNYDETVRWLFERLPMYSRIGAAAYKADLDNITALCKALGDPQLSFRSIHIAGTNGKGSTSHMLASVLQEAGYRTGLHTSPHLYDFRERIRVNGELVSEDFVIRFTERIKPVISTLNPSFFEITVAMAFEWFREREVYVAVIETGLGGRLDSTNILTPVLSVITNIGWDHMNLLGNTLTAIAREKAGIIKRGIPVVIGEILPETEPVFREKAAAMDASVHIASLGYQVTEWEWLKEQLHLQVASPHRVDHLRLMLDLPGIYQLKNAVTVLASLDLLRENGWVIPEEAVTTGLSRVRRNTGLGGRWEVRGHHPLLVIDVAHNEAGIRQVMEQLELMQFRRLHLILGVVNDKDTGGVLNLLPREANYYFTQAQIPRALPARELADRAAEAGLSGQVCSNVDMAIREARTAADEEDVILVIGSIFLVAEVRMAW